jgi:hypothetical protein
MFVATSQTQVMSGAFFVAGDVAVSNGGALMVAPLANVNVSGTFNLTGLMRFFYPANVSIAMTSNIDVTSSMELVLTDFPGLTAVIPVLTSVGGLSGQFMGDAVCVKASFAGANGLSGKRLTTTSSPASSCYIASGQPQYGQTSLSVVVQLIPVDCAKTSSASLSNGEIIGIAVGSVCGGILIALGIAALVIFLRNRRTQFMNSDLRRNDVQKFID